MRRRLMMMAAALLVAAPAWASLAVLLATDDRVIVASDSRQWDTTCECPHPDAATKILVRPPFAVAVTHDPAPRSAAAHLPLVAGESAADFAQRILDAVPHGPVASESTIAVVRFGGDAIVRHVRFEPEGRLVVLREAAPTLPVALVLGWPFAPDDEMAAIVQRLTAELRTQPSEARLLDMAETTLQMGAARSPKIGGPMHLAVLDADGVRTPTASGGPRRWNGTGFWLDATGTPTFRVGNPSGNLLEWDGTNLTLVSQSLTIDESGLRFTVPSGFSDTTSYRWAVADGFLGTKAQFNTNQYDLMLQGYYDGATTSTILNTSLASLYDASSGGNQAIAAVTATAYADFAEVAITAAAYTGDAITTHQIRLNGELQLENQLTQTTIGANGAAAALTANPVGYVKIKINGTYYLLPVYNP